MFSIPLGLARDNVQWIKENSERNYVNCLQNLIARAPFGQRQFYIFSVIKRVDDLAGVKKIYHQARLTKPAPIPGATLLRVDPRDPGACTILWTLPQAESFRLYGEGKVFGDPFVHDCVRRFLSDPQELMQPADDDPSEEEIRDIYRQIRPRIKDKTQIQKSQEA